MATPFEISVGDWIQPNQNAPTGFLTEGKWYQVHEVDEDGYPWVTDDEGDPVFLFNNNETCEIADVSSENPFYSK
jgi:hypothetical protein